MRHFLIIAVLCCVAQASTHYISTSTVGASDSNNGTAKATPWLHSPGMTGCTASCSSYTVVAGDQFIFKGGDTWSGAIGLDIETSGNSSTPNYYGVDKTWFSGGSWARPIFDYAGTAGRANGGGAINFIGGNWNVIDNFEFKGYQQCASGDVGCTVPGGNDIIVTFGNDNEVENNYIHGWSRTTASSGFNSYCFSNNFGSGGA